MEARKSSNYRCARIGCLNERPYFTPVLVFKAAGGHAARVSTDLRICQEHRESTKIEAIGFVNENWDIFTEGFAAPQDETPIKELTELEWQISMQEFGLNLDVGFTGDKSLTFAVGYMGDRSKWCYWATDYPDEGSVGPFENYDEALVHAEAGGAFDS